MEVTITDPTAMLKVPLVEAEVAYSSKERPPS
jgi:hypothetical protein